MSESETPETRQAQRDRLRLAQAQQLTEETAQKLLSFIERSEPVRRLRASQVASAVTGTLGFVLFILGVEGVVKDLPIVSNAYGSLAAGFVLLLATGLLLQKLTGRE